MNTTHPTDEAGSVAFVHMRPWTPAYQDFRRMAELSGIPFVHLAQVNLSSDTTYVFWWLDDVAKEIIGRCGSPKRKARVVLWNLERAFEQTADGLVAHWPASWLEYVDELWLSCPEYVRLARSDRARFVLLASHAGLGEPPSGHHRWDVVHSSFLTERRAEIVRRLSDLRVAPKAWGKEREAIFRSGCLLVDVHQDEFPVMAPLRIAIAAAYSLPVVAEACASVAPGYEALVFAEYDGLEAAVRRCLADGQWLEEAGRELHERLCVTTDLGREIRRAVATPLRRPEAQSG